MTIITQMTPTAAQAGVRRASVQRGLRAFYEFLDGHPGLPLGDPDPFLYSAKLGTEEQNRAEVDRVARILGVTAADSPAGGRYSAARDFGAGVTYSAWALTADDMSRCERRRAALLAPAGAVA